MKDVTYSIYIIFNVSKMLYTWVLSAITVYYFT